jgi:uncharacterized protein YegP (UPF0339 family)
MRHHTVEIYLGTDNAFRWRRIASNGAIIADSGEGYTALADAHMAVFRVFGQPWVLAEHLDVTQSPHKDQLLQEPFDNTSTAQPGDPDGQSW